MINLFKLILIISIIFSSENENKFISSTFETYCSTPKYISMGRSITANIDDASSIFYNPAGLSRINGYSSIIGYTIETRNYGGSLNDISYTHGALGKSFDNMIFNNLQLSVGIGYQLLKVKEIITHDELMNYTGKFNYNSHIISFGLAANYRFINIGLKWKSLNKDFGYNNTEIGNRLSPLWSSMSLQYRLNKKIALGFVYEKEIDIGEYDIVPKYLVIGLGYKSDKMTANMDILNNDYRLNELNTGFEYIFNNYGNIKIPFRVGLSGIQLNKNTIGFENNLKTGFGFGININNSLYIDFGISQNYMPNLISPYSRIFVVGLKYE